MDDRPTPPRPRLPRWLVPSVLAVALLAGVFAARYLAPRLAAPPRTLAAAVFARPRPLPAFMLTAHDGTAYTAARLRGHYTLVLFGYTNCPDVCPTTLLELARTRTLLADLPAARQPRVAMISVDPERDTPERLAGYVSHFDPSFVGLTGTVPAVDALAQSLGVAIERGPPRDGNYAVDHTAALFLIDPEARLIAVFPAPHLAATVAADYRAILAGARG
jgi:protein SCO1/2